MIFDRLNEFCDGTGVNKSTGKALIGDVIDLGAGGFDIGAGEPVYLVISVEEDVVSSGGSVSFVLSGDDKAAISVDGTESAYITTPTIPTTDLKKGFQWAAALPMMDYERYIGIVQNSTTAAPSAGKINAFLTHDVQSWKATPDGI